MKQTKNILALFLCTALCVNILSGCEINLMNDKPSQEQGGTGNSGITDSEIPTEPETPIDPELPTNPETPTDPELPTNPETPTDPEIPTDPENPTDPELPTDPETPSEPEDKGDADEAEREKYSYRPQIFEQMPTVEIITENGSNDFITRPTRNDKLAGNIDYVSATVSVKNSDGTQLSGDAQVKARGNYTLNEDKKSIRIKFEEKQNMLGLNGGQNFKSWVLLADYKDLSALNNATAFYLGKTILGSDGYYCSDFCTVEVYINEQYWGVYLLAEQQEAKQGRANAVEADKGETGIDVGYLMEYDGYYAEENSLPDDKGDPTFTIDYGTDLKRLDGSSYTPWQPGFTVKSETQSTLQLSFLRSYMQNAFRILRAAAYENKALKFNADFSGTERADCTPREAVEAVVDLPSLVDTYLLQEITCDPDIAWSSFYISLDMRAGGGQKLIFEAPWDYDSAFGIKWNTVNGAYKLYAANCDNPWFSVLINTDFFQMLVKEKWEKLIQYDVFKNALSLITEQTKAYESDYDQNINRWRQRLGGYGELTYEMNQIVTQEGAAEHLYRWLYARLNYLNTIFGNGKDILAGNEWPVPSAPDAALRSYRFEAENCAHHESMKLDDYYRGASGGAFLGQVQQGSDVNRLVTLTINAAEETDAYLSIGLSKRAFKADFSDWFAVFVNGAKLWLPPRPIEACEQGEVEWGAWTKIDLTTIHLKKGENTILLNMVSDTASNLDYFELYSKTEITMIYNW